jgi:thiol-disulfide isomerase/thioredoxin
MSRFVGLCLLAIVCVAVCPLSHAGSTVKPVQVGPLKDMQGAQHDVARSLKQGKNVVFVFWQTWCANCAREAPAMVAASKTYVREFDFFGVVSGEDEFVDDRKVRKMTASLALSYPQIRDRDLSLSATFKVKGTPTIVIVGPGMVPIYVGHRAPDDWSAYAPKS